MTTAPTPSPAPTPSEAPKPVMKTWKPTTAGILIIIAGILGIIAGIVAIAVGGSMAGAFIGFGLGGVAFGVVSIILSIIAIIGGRRAMRRTHWVFVLVSAVISVFLAWLLGILAIIFLVMGRDEFGKTR